jgi:hypothetical protein
MRRESTPPLWSPKRVAEAGPQAIGGNARAMQAAGEFAREKNVAKLGASIGFHGSEALRRLQIVEIERGSPMRARSRVDDTRRRGSLEPFAQPFGDDEIGHVVQRECLFEPVLREPAAAEHGSRVIDQDVDARLLAGDFGGHALHLGDLRQIGVMDRVGEAGRAFLKPPQCCLST